MIFNIFFMKSGLLLLDLKILKIYDTPVLISLNVICQIFLLTLIVEIFTSTTSVNEIMKGFNYLTGKKGKNTEISLIYTFSIYFLPIVHEELKKIIEIAIKKEYQGQCFGEKLLTESMGNLLKNNKNSEKQRKFFKNFSEEF